MLPTLYRTCAVAAARSADLLIDQSILVVNGLIRWMGPDEDTPPLPPETKVVDAAGAVAVPGMVDAHSHVTLPGGAHWIARIDDATDELLSVAEDNGELMWRSGVRWARDVGSPRRPDPDGERDRALALVVRDRWQDRADRPYVRAAGTWISAAGTLPPKVAIELEHGSDLVAAVEAQLDDGADLVKLYLDGPDRTVAPFTADEVSAATATAHARGVKVTAHATQLTGVRAAVDGGVDCVEHASTLDDAIAMRMADRGVFAVPTLGVLESFLGFGSTTSIDRFARRDGRTALLERREVAHESVRIAVRAGIPIAAGTDFGGGSLRANQMAWEITTLVTAGLEPWQALAAATWRGGELIGEPGAGRFIVGGPADFFLVHGNPLEDPSALWKVWRHP